jgi:16S rRNA (guanine527-N7)-methyltransferase
VWKWASAFYSRRRTNTLEEMDADRISALLKPFLGGNDLNAEQLEKVQVFLELLRRWNAKTNLTSIRNTEEIITRHFGESFFLASQLRKPSESGSAIDFGSGAGFPGIPLAIYAPLLRVALIESQNKKATFLKEAVRALALTNVTVFAERGESFVGHADLVTMRAVEKFEQSANAAATLVAPGGRMALLIADGQVKAAKAIAGFGWAKPVKVPNSRELVLLVGTPEVRG